MTGHLRPSAPTPEGVILDVTPEDAGWTYASIRVVDVALGGRYVFDTRDSEWIALPLTGAYSVSCGDSTLDLVGRTSVFDRVSDFAYLPCGSEVTVASELGGRIALLGAKTSTTLPFRYGSATDVPVELRGAGSASRQCNNFAAPDAFETDRLVAVEVLVPGGNWASYPPHKHDETRPGEAQLEEIYYFEVRGGAPPGEPGPGGYQRVYASDAARPIDITVEVKSGDVVLIPHGYHGPTMAAPGYDLYFLNVLAGPEQPRSMAFCDDPEHAWVRPSWNGQAVDSRLPLTSAEVRS